MTRTIEQWKGCEPKAMAYEMSNAAIYNAFVDAKADILELQRKCEGMKAILSKIAYPRRGTEDESLDIQKAAEIIQSQFTVEQLS